MSPIRPFLRTPTYRGIYPELGETMTIRHKDRLTTEFVPPGHFYPPIPSVDEIQR
jgi:hypothetical protein